MCTLLDGLSGIIESFVICVPFARDVGFSLPTERRSAIVRYGSLFATLQRNSSICFSGKIAGHPDQLPVESAQCALFLVSITDTFP